MNLLTSDVELDALDTAMAFLLVSDVDNECDLPTCELVVRVPARAILLIKTTKVT